jgi:hypothetical protein
MHHRYTAQKGETPTLCLYIVSSSYAIGTSLLRAPGVAAFSFSSPTHVCLPSWLCLVSRAAGDLHTAHQLPPHLPANLLCVVDHAHF